MKNIHVLPTDKPSRLWINNLLQGKLELSKEMLTGSNTAQNIYITSNEDIKEGVDQWYLDKVLNEPYNSGGAQYSSKQDVIILTTDQDLIKDGVQSIDDAFLEWFIKNPSCEEVEMELVALNKYGSEISVNSYGFEKFGYKIIIPKEEPEFIQINQDNPVTRGSTALVRNPKYQREMTQEPFKNSSTNTAVEWLFEQYKLIGMLTTDQVQKAKQMEKRENTNAIKTEIKLIGNYFDVSKLDVKEHAHHIRFTSILKDRFDYYNETFNTKEK